MLLLEVLGWRLIPLLRKFVLEGMLRGNGEAWSYGSVGSPNRSVSECCYMLLDLYVRFLLAGAVICGCCC